MPTIEIIGALFSLLYLRFEYKAKIWLWPVGIITSVFYIYIFFASKLYAIMGINVYYMLASIYGWYCWKKHTPSESGSQIIRLLCHPERSRRISPRFPRFLLFPRFPLFPLHLIWKLLAIFVCLYVLIAWILASQTDSPVPYVDALTAALSIVGMWLLAHKYAEQWLIWLVSNTISAGLYCWMALYPTSILYLIYAIVAIFGFRKWRKMAVTIDNESFWEN